MPSSTTHTNLEGMSPERGARASQRKETAKKIFQKQSETCNLAVPKQVSSDERLVQLDDWMSNPTAIQSLCQEAVGAYGRANWLRILRFNRHVHLFDSDSSGLRTRFGLLLGDEQDLVMFFQEMKLIFHNVLGMKKYFPVHSILLDESEPILRFYIVYSSAGSRHDVRHTVLFRL